MGTDACLAVGWQRLAGTLEELETQDTKEQHVTRLLKNEHYKDNLDVTAVIIK